MPLILRRGLIMGAGASLLAPPGLAASASPLILTPGQTEGPFYPTSFPADTDSDLVRVTGQARQAVGQVTHIMGRVLNRLGEPLSGALVEIWQCDANGIYDHPAARGGKRRDTAFQGYGRSAANASGRYSFRTIRPVAYAGRTPHIHFKISAPGIAGLTTQMYVAGEPRNASDAVLGAIRNRAQRESVIVALSGAGEIEAGALKGTFDIVLDA
jgi:protocatechuate 3,4-dioxygenase beta subunit